MAAAVMLCPRIAAADVTDRVSRTMPLAADGVLVIEASMAVVQLVGTTRGDVHVEIARTAPTREDLARFPVVIDTDGPRLRVTVVQAGTDARLQATIRVEVPARARIASLRVAEGRLEVTDFAGTLAADVRRGPIVASGVSGVLRLETGIGDLEVRRARLTPDGLLRLRTFNGDVRLSFDETPADARVMALALNGTISSQVPLMLKTAWGPRWGEATIGRGEPVVSLDVVTGDIIIETTSRR
jgi:hypothetical protein